MAIKIEGEEDFDLLQCVSFVHNRALKQEPQPTLSFSWKPIHFDDVGRKSWPDTPVQSAFFENIDTTCISRAMEGKPALAEAFVAMQIAMAEIISERTGKNCYYVAD